MNTLQAAASAAQRASVRPGSSGAGLSPTTPTSPQPRGQPRGSSGSSGAAGRKRTLNDAFGNNGIKVEPNQQSPTSAGESYEDKDESRIGVKRACNECRQQKLRCDVVQDPFQACSRCKRCSLECRIDSNFKRIGKRKRNAEMEREIVELKQQLASQQAMAAGSTVGQTNVSQGTLGQAGTAHGLPVPQISHSPLDQYMGSQEAVASLLDLKSGSERGFGRSPGPDGKPVRRLEGVVLTHTQVDELFHIFFTYYHPLQPLLNPERSADFYYEQCQLLFWTVISVAARHHAPAPVTLQDISKGLTHLLWATIADVPQSYLVVKALCMLCVWPLPISSTSSDPTFMISGLMLQIAMQIGLHRPSHAQDFSKFRIDLREEELKDRVKTWAACNVVAQRVATGYGQPASTHYDWTLQERSMDESGFKLPDEMDARLRIEMITDKITKSLYGNKNDPVGFVDQDKKPNIVASLAKELKDLETVKKSSLNSVNQVYLLAANLHLRLSVFFDSHTSPTYEQDLRELWNATKSYLEQVFKLETPAGGNILKYSTGYILQMIIACSFTLLKLLNSFFARLIDLEDGKALFSRSIQAIRQISTLHNDLPSRLAEVLAQLWRASGAGSAPSPGWDGTADDKLELRVRCRMSMSLCFDSVWRWREDFQAKGRGNLENALQNPTNPDSTNGSTISTLTTATNPPAPTTTTTTTTTTTLNQPQLQEPQQPTSTSNTTDTLTAAATAAAAGGSTNKLDSMLAPPTSTSVSRAPTPVAEFGFSTDWEVFDPLNWMLDGVGEWPYMFGAEGQEVDAGLSSI